MYAVYVCNVCVRPHVFDVRVLDIRRVRVTRGCVTYARCNPTYTYLYSDDSGDLARHRHRPVPAASPRDRDRLLGHVGAVLGVLDHRLGLAVLVHRDRHDLFL